MTGRMDELDKLCKHVLKVTPTLQQANYDLKDQIEHTKMLQRMFKDI